jgi:hypothetical protein
MLLQSIKYITNNIRRYTHSHSQSSIKKLNLDEKLDKIMLNLDEIEINVKGIYYVSLITGLILIFK